jgi:hypothetical protein
MLAACSRPDLAEVFPISGASWVGFRYNQSVISDLSEHTPDSVSPIGFSATHET